MAGGAAGAQQVCFRTAGEAAVQSGARDRGGFWLEGVSRDVVGRRDWATLRRCGHADWPAMVVRVEGGPKVVRSSRSRDEGAADMGHPSVLKPLVVAGAKVKVVAADAMVRMELSGVVQGPGSLGDVVKVRVLGDGDERYVMGMVKSAELVEMVR